MRHRNLRGRGCPSKAIIGVLFLLLLGIVRMPLIANAATTTTSATSEQYQFYDQRTRDQQVSVNKVWDDGLSNDTRTLYSYSYENWLSITIQTGVPQITLPRIYTITYDANGGDYGTDTNGTITTNTIIYNTENQPMNGTYITPERTDGYSLIGWSTNKTATSPDTSITLTNAPTDSWMNARTDGSNTTLYAVWKYLHINYAVMAYGIGIDKDANGNSMGITFGPALGYPEFSYWKNGSYDDSSTQTFTKSHSVSGNATVMSESTTACTDDTHSVIIGTDAGTDAAGNAYRCLHYDNWTTIIYWNEHDPHVYDKCIPNHCSKTVVIIPNAGTIGNGIFNTNTSDSYPWRVGDGQPYIVRSYWDKTRNVNITQAGQGYAASLVRAELVGADSHTKLDDNYAGVDAITRYTADSSILSCFPRVLRDAIGAKALSGVSAAVSAGQYHRTFHDVVSNDGVADKLWLFSHGEMVSAVYPSTGFRNDDDFDTKRSSRANYWWLRSPINSRVACDIDGQGGTSGDYVDDHSTDYPTDRMVAPGFTLP